MKVTKEMERRCRAWLAEIKQVGLDPLELFPAMLSAALADVPEPLGTAIYSAPDVPAPAEFPFKLKENEREYLKSARAYGDRHHGYLLNIIDRAVRSAELAPLGTVINYDPKSPPSTEFPFRLSDEEEMLVFEHEQTGHPAKIRRLAKLVRRAVRTLATPAVEPLSEADRCCIEAVRECVEHDLRPNTLTIKAALAVFDARFPKPETARKTAKELERIAIRGLQSQHSEERDAGLAAFAELVYRAEAGEP